MSPISRVLLAPSKVVHWLLSVPISIKILGIGALVAALFTGVIILYSGPRIEETLYSIHLSRARASTVSLAAMLERPVAGGDLFMARQHLDNTRLAFPDVVYGVIYDPQGRPVAHTFDGELPAELRAAPGRASQSHLRVTEGTDGKVFDVTEPIQGGQAGSLRLGTSDEVVSGQLAGLIRSVLVALLLCVVLGQSLALLLAAVLTRPIRHLARAAESIKQGDFSHRAEVAWGDEVGDLAVAFNEMAAALEGYQVQVQHKEESRRELIKRLVQAQEDERRGIALELHDELGQSLMAVLLRVHGLRRSGELSESGAEALEEQLQLITDEVRGIARRMRPSLLDHGGLEVALESYVEETTAHADMLIDYQRVGEERERLSSEVEVTLFRIAQESLTNVLRHSGASEASVVFSRINGEASLLIEDDGAGFDTECFEERRGCSGLGLMGMAERATLLGGHLSITSAPGAGTTVRVRIPTSAGRLVS